ncbi:filamentous hemagglutinin [Nostocales cyanobacterium HT-58-2]|nr:filamentous hemagglutinin [Nostocales cyanobacterium HT-58-2]
MAALLAGFNSIVVVICIAISFATNRANAQITPDKTLPENSRVTTTGNLKIIEGGTQVGSNLFHSFEQFSISTGTTTYFNNPADVQNIISRVMGNSISNIDGTLRVNGQSNLFLINPNGIIFGPNASLNIGGSFFASTASSLNFADGSKFSATLPQATPLLTVSVPVGLQFGATATAIRNQSQAKSDGATNILNESVGLQVPPGKTLVLVGGDLILDGGSLTASGGRIELGSVAANSLVSLKQTDVGWVLGYEGIQNFQNIQLTPRIISNFQIPSTVDASGKDSGGSIQMQGNSVELIGFPVRVINQSTGVANSGDLTITSRKLVIRDGAQVITSTRAQGAGGKLSVTSSESVELIGSFRTPDGLSYSSVLSSATFGVGKAGDLIINTRRLHIQDGALVTAESSGQRINNSQQFRAATGQGGNLTINASESVETSGMTAAGRPSGLFASTAGSGDAGKVTITTGQLIVRDGAAVTVSSETRRNFTYVGGPINLGKAGELNIDAGSIILGNRGKISSETDTGQGGNINLQVQDLLLLRRNSQISTNAGKVQAIGDGGNITINAPDGFIVAKPQENSDITANAFTGSGGKVQINATGIFGIAPRSRENLARQLGTNDPIKLDSQNLLTSDITAISQTNPTLNGVVSINTPDIEIKRGLINVPMESKKPRLAQGCDADVARNQSEFIITGGGGIPSNPREALRSNNVQVNWVSLDENANEPSGASSQEKVRQTLVDYLQQNNKNIKNRQNEIVEAQGWVVDSNGDVILVAQAPTVTPHSPSFNSASCHSR